MASAISSLENKVRILVRHPRESYIGFNEQYCLDYYVAMQEFKIAHPTAKAVTGEYISKWIAEYLIKNYHYMKNYSNGDNPDGFRN